MTTLSGLKLETSRYLGQVMDESFTESRHMPEPDRIKYIRSKMDLAYIQAEHMERQQAIHDRVQAQIDRNAQDRAAQ